MISGLAEKVHKKFFHPLDAPLCAVGDEENLFCIFFITFLISGTPVLLKLNEDDNKYVSEYAKNFMYDTIAEMYRWTFYDESNKDGEWIELSSNSFYDKNLSYVNAKKAVEDFIKINKITSEYFVKAYYDDQDEYYYDEEIADDEIEYGEEYASFEETETSTTDASIVI